MRATSAVGLVVVGLSTSFAAYDWMMSLDPHWVSTIFGVYFWSGSLLASLAAIVVAFLCVSPRAGSTPGLSVEHLHDLAKLLFGFVIFWAYIAFSQYFLIWYANLPEETRWYIVRRSGSWNVLSWGLAVGHFAVPFVLLLSRAVRRDRFWMGFLAAWVLIYHYLDLYWLVMPAYSAEGVQPGGADLSLLLSAVFLYGAIVAQASRIRALVPLGDPHLRESIAFRQD
jgi:hypothetical protein